jgi:hypothetical protein
MGNRGDQKSEVGRRRLKSWKAEMLKSERELGKEGK